MLQMISISNKGSILYNIHFDDFLFFYRILKKKKSFPKKI